MGVNDTQDHLEIHVNAKDLKRKNCALGISRLVSSVSSLNVHPLKCDNFICTQGIYVGADLSSSYENYRPNMQANALTVGETES